MTATETPTLPTADRPRAADRPTGPAVVLSFDIEEHDRIEAAARLTVPAEAKAVYAARMVGATERILDQLAAAGTVATFYIVGEIARTHPQLVRAIAAGGTRSARTGGTTAGSTRSRRRSSPRTSAAVKRCSNRSAAPRSSATARRRSA